MSNIHHNPDDIMEQILRREDSIITLQDQVEELHLVGTVINACKVFFDMLSR